MKFDGVEKQVIPANREKSENEVCIYQHLSNGKVQEWFAPVGKDYSEMVGSLGLMCECEVLSTGELALYVHYPEERDYGCELAVNRPGNDEPIRKLRAMIDNEWSLSSTEEERRAK